MERQDERWAVLQGAYRTPYDPRPALDRLVAEGAASAWPQLWQELHHQGDVGEASYAAVPELVRLHRPGEWNTFALAATIEEARHDPQNPPLPAWLQADYEAAWRQLLMLALSDLPDANSDPLTASLLAVVAFAKGQVTLGRMALLTDDERVELLDQTG